MRTFAVWIELWYNVEEIPKSKAKQKKTGR